MRSVLLLASESLILLLLLQEWMNSGSPYDLVFTTGFDNDQRKEMHQVARRLGLKSKSFGKGEDRHLTISRLRLWVIVTVLTVLSFSGSSMD